jgi:UDP-N-acetylglucosamine 2-epimerase (non-hydrolysing)
MRIMSVVGARPNFMKAAPIVSAIRDRNSRISPNRAGAEPGLQCPPIQHVLVHTGQHYDEAMSGSFFTDLGLPAPDIHLGVGSGSHAAQTAEIMRRFEIILLREKPDVLIVVGDVNSTMGCSLVAAKIAFDDWGTRPLIAHVEAGLRSFDRTMPEEINRIVTDHVSDLLFVTEESGLRNLANEGVPAEKIHFVGNTMIDSLLTYKDKAEASSILDDLGLRGGSRAIERYALLTLHRPSNVDSRHSFSNVLEGLQELVANIPVFFPAHPRTLKRIKEHGLEHNFNQNGDRHDLRAQTPGRTSCLITLIDPLGYLDFLCLMKHASLVVTDSGGVQEETTCLGIPCVTVRENTERPVTLTSGTNVLAGATKEGVRAAIRRQLRSGITGAVPELWDGRSADRILEAIIREVQGRRAASNGTVTATRRTVGPSEETGSHWRTLIYLARDYQPITSSTAVDASLSGAAAVDSKP